MKNNKSKYMISSLVLALASSLHANAKELDLKTSDQSMAIQAISKLDHIEFNNQGVPRQLKGRLGFITPNDFENKKSVSGFMKSMAGVFKLEGSEDFDINQVTFDKAGLAHIRLQQTINGLPVVGGDSIIHLDSFTGEIKAIDSNILPNKNLSSKPKLSKTQLKAKFINKQSPSTEAKLVYFLNQNGQGRLAWELRSNSTSFGNECEEIPKVRYIDAENGQTIKEYPLRIPAMYRKVYELKHVNNPDPCGFDYTTRTLKGEEGSMTPTATPFTTLWNYLKDTYDYFSNEHSLDSWDGNGAQIIASAHVSSNYNNAYWDGFEMVFGDGDGTNWSHFANSLDIVGHEFTHAVVERTAGLVYENESGALNESYADIFGSMVERLRYGQSSDTWKVGEDSYTPGTAGDALRYMNNPSQDGESTDYYPDRMTDPNYDRGGVHFNSGISNLAFYLMANGGTHPRNKTTINVSSIGVDKASELYFLTLRDQLTANSGFKEIKEKMVVTAKNLFGNNSTEHQTVCDAWNAVGVPNNSATDCDSAPPSSQLSAPTNMIVQPEYCYGLNSVSWNAVSGATNYQVWASYNSSFSSPYLMRTVSGTFTTANVNSTRYIRVKACNTTGCSDFTSNQGIARYFSGCY